MTTFRGLAAFALFGVFLLAGAVQAGDEPAAPDWSKSQTIQVSMADFAFSPNTLQFRANMPYRLRLVNSDLVQ